MRPGEIDPEAAPGCAESVRGAGRAWPISSTLVSCVANLLVTVGLLLASISLVVRYRRADPVEAAQIRWLALVAVLAAVCFAAATAPLGRSADLGLRGRADLPRLHADRHRHRDHPLPPLRHRSADQRALVYGSLTAILAGTFTAAVGLAQRIFVAVTNETSDAALVGATLVIATLYAPLRKRLEAVVDRRFKFEEARFGAYRDELDEAPRADRPDTRVAAACSTRQSGSSTRSAGAILDRRRAGRRNGRHLAGRAGRPHPAASRGRPLPASLALGPRPDGRDHDPRHVAALTDVAGLAATAIRQARRRRDRGYRAGRLRRMPAFRAPRGTRDLLPPERVGLARLERLGWPTSPQRYGYHPIETPLFEQVAVFERGIGEVTDVVEKELFLLAPREEDGERWALRPEPTAGIVRAYIQHGMQTWPQPVKVTMTGSMFRYDRPQAGRYRRSGSSTSRRSAIPGRRSTPRSSSWRRASTATAGLHRRHDPAQLDRRSRPAGRRTSRS